MNTNNFKWSLIAHTPAAATIAVARPNPYVGNSTQSKQTNAVKPHILITLALAGTLVVPALRAEEPSQWRFEVTPYALMPGIFGDISIGRVNAPVDVSFDTIWHNLEFTAMGTVGVGYGRWAFTTDVVYLGAGGSNDRGGLDFEQWMVEPTLSYAVCKGIEVLAGARYNNLSAEITGGPLGRNPSATQAWWDPLVGANLSLPLGRNFSVNLRGDIGGFGVNSDLTWQAYPFLGWQFAKWGSLQAGYRFYSIDYETGSGSSRFKYDVLYRGPQLGVTFSF